MLSYLSKEEQLNTISHAIGIVLGLLFLPILLVYNPYQDVAAKLSLWIYGLSFILLFSASTIYHAITHPQKKHLARKFDHISIFFLIAGTYTPVCLITLKDTTGITLFLVVWGIAFTGLLMKIFLTGKLNKLSTILYVGMGWIAVIEFKNLYELFNPQAFASLIIGGICYTIGVYFYASKTIKYAHFIWHLFVLAGAISHFLMVLFMLVK